MLVLEA
jgi:hypothetical protein